MKIFGTECFVHVPKHKRQKLDAKSRKGYLVGYCGDKDSYRIYMPECNDVVISRDVIFKEELTTSTEQTEISKEESETAFDEESQDDNSDMQHPPCMQLRDHRCINLPARYDDFVLTAGAMFDSAEPDSFEEAVNSDHSSEWQKAMQSEMQSLKDNQTWELEDLPPGKKAIPCKWVYKVKYNPDGSIERYKARLVIKGFSQKKGVDYDQTFSPVVRNASVRTHLSIAAIERMHLLQFDISTAFLYGELDEELYMKQPEGFSDNTDKVCKLKRSLYGLKQAPRCWNRRFVTFLRSIGFRQSDADPCLFVLNVNSHKLLLALYVDDGIVAATDKLELLELAEKLKSEFKITVKPATYFLGFEIDQQCDGSVKISQAAYTRKLLERFGMSECRSCVTPIISAEKAEADNNTEVKSVEFPYR